MKSAIVKNKAVEIQNISNPELGANDILVKMQACGICGSDVEKVFGEYGQPSMRLGHEPSGIILEIGNDVKNFKKGDRVFTHHHVACYSENCHECSHGNETMCSQYYQSNLNPCGLSEEYIVPEWNIKHGGILKLPDTMSYEEAAMIEPLACCIRTWNKFKFQKNDSVVILGTGPTGVMHAMLAKYFGLGKIFCLDRNEFRLNFTNKLGFITINSNATDISDKIKSETENRGADIVIVATGNLIALKNSFTYVRKGGTVVLFGVPSKGEIIDIDMSNVYSKEITLVTTYAASDYDTKSALELISSGNIDVKSLITHKYSLDESMKAFQHAKSGDSAMKIIIKN